MNNQETLCQQFVQKHNITMTDIVRREEAIIYWTHRARNEIQALGPLISNKPIETQFVWLALNQVFDHTEGSLVALIVGFDQSANVIARTVAESAVTLMYILETDSKDRIFQYLLHSIQEERNRLDKLHKSKEGAYFEPSYFDNHFRTCDVFEKIIKIWADSVGCVIPNKKWPDTFRLFEQTGYEAHYRTAYAMMSGATHATSANLLSTLVYLQNAIASGQDDSLEAFLNSAVLQQRMAVYGGILYCLEAAIKFCNSNELVIAARGVYDGKDAIQSALAILGHEYEQVTEILRE